jgi:hypothetical protein
VRCSRLRARNRLSKGFELVPVRTTIAEIITINDLWSRGRFLSGRYILSAAAFGSPCAFTPGEPVSSVVPSVHQERVVRREAKKGDVPISAENDTRSYAERASLRQCCSAGTGSSAG